MKKLLSLVFAVAVSISLVSCAADKETNGSVLQNSSDITEIADSRTVDYDQELLAILEKAIDTVQPGTAGSSLKAIYAARDIINYLKDNNPDFKTMAATVKYLFESGKYADEAEEAFKSIKSVFETLTESEYAQQLLDSVEIKLSELDLSPDIMARISQLFDEIEKHIETTE